jgi:hypothetical protein
MDRSPRWLAVLDRASIALCVSLWCLSISRLAPQLLDSNAVLPLVVGALAGYLLADLVSGSVHWIADRFFDPRTPILGPALIAPFREHHADPSAMTRHDFFEISGNNGLATIPLALGLLFAPPPTTRPMQTVVATIAFFGLSIIATNQLHCWAHAANPPRLVRWLQRCGLILSPERHLRHHQARHDRAYCVTSGWLNPILDHFRVFARLERRLAALRHSPERTT